jgi:DNA-binding NtrC family response regulator
VDCGAIHATLLESELFGHEKGAFTGAPRGRRGLFETAGGGTVFLDEIGEIPWSSSRRCSAPSRRRKCGPSGRPSTGRSTSASSPRPTAARGDGGAGKFRRDLFYRLNVVAVRVPPLRERKDDIPLLVQHFLQKRAGAGGRSVTGISPDALHLLQRYDWPGNVRELEHIIDRACTLGQTERIEPADLGPRSSRRSRAATRARQSIEEMEVAPSAACSTTTGRHGAGRRGARHRPQHALPQDQALPDLAQKSVSCGRAGPGTPRRTARAILRQPRLLPRQLEERRDLLRVDSLAAHPRSEARVVEGAAAHLLDPVQDLLLAVGEVVAEPLLERSFTA